MSLKHFWYTLLDKEGEPVNNANVYIYKEETTTELSIYDTTTTKIIQPIITGSDGIIDFYIKDQYESSDNYGPDQKMKISWSASASSVSGEIDNAEIFDKVYKFEDFSAGDDQPTNYTYKNKLVSNQKAYNWNTHITATSETVNLHNILPVDIYDDSDNTYNKLVNNDLMNDLWSLLASAQNPTIVSSGAVARTFEVSGSGLSWTASGDFYYDDFNHQFTSNDVIVQIYEDTGKELFKPYRIIPLDTNNTRIFIYEDIAAWVTIIG